MRVGADICVIILEFLPGQRLYGSVSRLFFDACESMDADGKRRISRDPEYILRMVMNDYPHSGHLIADHLTGLGHWLVGRAIIFTAGMANAAVRLKCKSAIYYMSVESPSLLVGAVWKSGDERLMRYCREVCGEAVTSYLVKTSALNEKTRGHRYNKLSEEGVCSTPSKGMRV